MAKRPALQPGGMPVNRFFILFAFLVALPQWAIGQTADDYKRLECNNRTEKEVILDVQNKIENSFKREESLPSSMGYRDEYIETRTTDDGKTHVYGIFEYVFRPRKGKVSLFPNFLLNFEMEPDSIIYVCGVASPFNQEDSYIAIYFLEGDFIDNNPTSRFFGKLLGPSVQISAHNFAVRPTGPILKGLRYLFGKVPFISQAIDFFGKVIQKWEGKFISTFLNEVVETGVSKITITNTHINLSVGVSFFQIVKRIPFLKIIPLYFSNKKQDNKQHYKTKKGKFSVSARNIFQPRIDQKIPLKESPFPPALPDWELEWPDDLEEAMEQVKRRNDPS